MSKLELKSEYLSLVQQLLARYVPDAEVWAYGSRVKHQSHAGSDLDLVVRNPHNLQQSEPAISALQQAFSNSNLPILVDVLDWAKLPESFHAEIQAHHISILPKKKS